MQRTRAHRKLSQQVFRICALALCVPVFLLPYAHGQQPPRGGDSWMQPPDPDNPFNRASGPRSNWIPAAMPPTAAEIDKNPELILEGNWQIEWSGHPDFDSAKVWITKGLRLDSDCSLGRNYATCRDPDQPVTIRSLGATKIDGTAASHATRAQLSADGTRFELQHSGAESGAISSVLRRTGDPDVLTGNWVTEEHSGAEIWRRLSRPTISGTSCRYQQSTTAAERGRPCEVEIAGYPGQGAMRGNTPAFSIDVLGENFYGAGPLPAFLDWNESSLELNRFCYLYERPFSADPRNNCASWGEPSDQYGDIIGVRLTIHVTYGALPGTYAAWVGGQPVPFTVNLPDAPNEILPDQSVDMEISATGPQSGMGKRTFLVRNNGPATATGLAFGLSSEQPFCPYETGCDGPAHGLAQRIPVCPFGESNTSFDCFECALDPNLMGDKSARYTCPTGRLRSGDTASVEMQFDPRPTEIPGQPVLHESGRSCLTAQTVSVLVTASQVESDTSNIVAETTLQGDEPTVIGLKFMRVLNIGAENESYDAIDTLYPGQSFVVEADLDAPICGWSIDEAQAHRSDARDYAEAISTTAPLQLFSTKGRLATTLDVTVESAKLLRSSTVTLESVLDMSQVVPEAGDALEAKSGDVSITARIGELKNLAVLKLTGFDLQGNESSARALPPGAAYTAEMTFRDGRGPIPGQAQYVITIDRVYCDVHEAEGENPVPNDCRDYGTAAHDRRPLALNRVSDGVYRSPRTTNTDNRTISVTGKSAYVTGASPLHKLAFTTPQGSGEVAFAKLGRDGRITSGMLGVQIFAPMLVEISNLKFPADPPEKLAATLMVRGKGGTAAAATHDISIPTTKRNPGNNPQDAGIYSEFLTFGHGYIFPKVREGDEVRVSVPAVGAVSEWASASFPYGEPLGIQVLPIGEGVDIAAPTVEYGGEVVVRLTFKPDSYPDATLVPIELIHSANDTVLTTLEAELGPQPTAPHVYTSAPFKVDGALFRGPDSGDVITAVYARKRTNQEVKGSIEIAWPPGTPDSVRFVANDKTITKIPAGSSAIIEVTLKSKPADGEDVGKVTANTAASFRVGYDASSRQEREFVLSPSVSDPLRYRTGPILFAGAAPPPTASTRHVDVMPGYEVVAEIDGKTAVAGIVNPPAGNNATFKVEITGANGKKKLARVLATNSVGGNSFEFVTHSTVLLPDGHYYITVELPATYRIGKYLNGGTTITHKIPAADTGEFLVTFADGKTTATSIVASRIGAPLSNWGTTGAVLNGNRALLPRGKYSISVEVGDKTYNFENVEIAGGKETKRSIK